VQTTVSNDRSRPWAAAGAVAEGALDGLEPLGPHHLARFKSAVESGLQVGWAYYLPYLLAHEKPGKRAMLVSEEEGSLCVFRRDTDGSSSRVDLVFPPIPMSSIALRTALERANEHNGDRSARVLRIDGQDADAVASNPSLSVRQRRLQYIFAPARYETLAGSTFHTVRRNVTLLRNRPDVEVERFLPRHVDECRALLAAWRERHTKEQGTGGGVGFTRRVLSLVGVLPEADLSGEVVLIEGRVSAFALGGMIRPGVGCSLERKSDSAVRGLSYFHFRSFLWSLRRFEQVNDGSDVERLGIRQFKDSFRPVAMLPEFRATQDDAPPTTPPGKRRPRRT
jgi:hypothetical protein